MTEFHLWGSKVRIMFLLLSDPFSASALLLFAISRNYTLSGSLLSGLMEAWLAMWKLLEGWIKEIGRSCGTFLSLLLPWTVTFSPPASASSRWCQILGSINTLCPLCPSSLSSFQLWLISGFFTLSSHIINSLHNTQIGFAFLTRLWQHNRLWFRIVLGTAPQLKGT